MLALPVLAMANPGQWALLVHALCCAVIVGGAGSLAATAWHEIRAHRATLAVKIACVAFVLMCLSNVALGADLIARFMRGERDISVMGLIFSAAVASVKLMIATGRLPNPVIRLERK